MPVETREFQGRIEWFNPATGAVILTINEDGSVTFASASFDIGAGGIDTAELAALAVTTAKIAALAVTPAELASSAVETAKIAAAAVTQAKLEEGSVVFVDKQFTNAEVKTLATGSGLALVSAPGANKALVFHAAHLVADAGDTAWVEPSQPDDLIIQYADGVDLSGDLDGTPLVANDVSFTVARPLAAEVVPDVNAAINLFNKGNQWTGGNAANTLSVRTWYAVVETVAFS